MTPRAFRDGYDRIHDDLTGERPVPASRAFAEVAEAGPELVAENDDALYDLCLPGNPDAVQFNAISALVLADYEYDGEFLDDDTYQVLNAMLEHDDVEVRRSVSRYLVEGVRGYDYAVYGDHVGSALTDPESVEVRLRAAQAPRSYVAETGDHEQLRPCVDEVVEALSTAAEKATASEEWYLLAEELVRLAPHLLELDPGLIDVVDDPIAALLLTRDERLVVACTEAFGRIARTNPDYFAESEADLRSWFGKHGGWERIDEIRANLLRGYSNYAATASDVSAISDAMPRIVDYYGLLGESSEDLDGRSLCLRLFRNYAFEAGVPQALAENAAYLSRELEDSDSGYVATTVLGLYAMIAGTFGPHLLKGCVDDVPRYLDDPELRGLAANVLLSLDGTGELDRLGVDRDEVARLHEREAATDDDVFRPDPDGHDGSGG